MQAVANRQVRDGAEYIHLFPAATGVIKTVKADATVSDTLSFIKKIVPATLPHTVRIADVLNAGNTYSTCRNIWNFVYRHIRYRKDKDGYEQVRSPRRSWLDRYNGVDCDCYTTFISSILSNLRIPHILRITKYGKPHFQHIYPVVPDNGGYITVDCVTNRFDYEVPFTEKKDVHMDLQFLDGLDALPYSSAEDKIIDGLDGDDDFGELGLFGKKKKKKQVEDSDPLKNPDSVPSTGKKKRKGFFRKVLNVANKLNPATVLLRNGILAAMKLNVGKIGSRMRWSYISPNAAKNKGIDLERYRQLVKIRQKLEDIFSNAGGNPANMRKAILKGKGNKDHAVVNGLLGLGDIMPDDGIMRMNIYTPLQQLLGPEIYHDENINGMQGFEGFGALGEPVTLASVAAASSVIAAIAASLKKIGNIFKSKQTEGSEDFSEGAAAAATNDVAAVKNAVPAAAASNPAVAEAATMTTSQNSEPALPATSNGINYSSGASPSVTSIARITSPGTDAGTDTESAGDDVAVAISKSADKVSSNSTDTKENFWNKNMTWLIPVGVGVVGLGLYKIASKISPSPAAPRSEALNGPPIQNYHKSEPQAGGSKGKQKKMTPVALM